MNLSMILTPLGWRVTQAEQPKGYSAEVRKLLRAKMKEARNSGLQVTQCNAPGVKLYINRAKKGGAVLTQPHPYAHYVLLMRGKLHMSDGKGFTLDAVAGDRFLCPAGGAYVIDCLEDVEFICVHPE